MNPMKKIPQKTIERLSLYRRLLSRELSNDRDYIFSHQLAALAHFSSAQIRRDLMEIDHMGNPNKGYNVAHLISEISLLLGTSKVKNVGIVGVGNLGRALLSYFVGRREDLPIVASFDQDSNVVGRHISGCPCHSVNEIKDVIKEKNIQIVIMAIPLSEVQGVTDECVEAGIKSFINFTHLPLKVPESVFVENIDITLVVEKSAYFAE